MDHGGIFRWIVCLQDTMAIVMSERVHNICTVFGRKRSGSRLGVCILWYLYIYTYIHVAIASRW